MRHTASFRDPVEMPEANSTGTGIAIDELELLELVSMVVGSYLMRTMVGVRGTCFSRTAKCDFQLWRLALGMQKDLCVWLNWLER